MYLYLSCKGCLRTRFNTEFLFFEQYDISKQKRWNRIEPTEELFEELFTIIRNKTN